MNPKFAIPALARLPEEDITKVDSLLNLASFHYADDSTSEWKYGAAAVEEAAGIMAKGRWLYSQVEILHQKGEYLVSKNQVANAVLKQLHKEIDDVRNA